MKHLVNTRTHTQYGYGYNNNNLQYTIVWIRLKYENVYQISYATRVLSPYPPPTLRDQKIVLQLPSVCKKGFSVPNFILLFFCASFENENGKREKIRVTLFWIVAILTDLFVVALLCLFAYVYVYVHFLFSWKMTNWILVHPSYVPFVFVQSSSFAYKQKHRDTQMCNQRELYPVLQRNKRNESMFKSHQPQKDNKRELCHQ